MTTWHLSVRVAGRKAAVWILLHPSTSQVELITAVKPNTVFEASLDESSQPTSCIIYIYIYSMWNMLISVYIYYIVLAVPRYNMFKYSNIVLSCNS